jgi:hypothetical protein
MNGSDTVHPQQAADPAAFELRDDNLRLLFSEAARRDLHERLQAIEKGVVVLALAVLLSLTASVVAILSPLILSMLWVERRKCRRELKDLNALLKRYGRA